GDSHVTAYCPEIPNWDHHKAFVVTHWVDAGWVFPRPAVTRAGTEHVFTTRVFRRTDNQPLAGYRVRYRLLDGPPGYFREDRGPRFAPVTDLDGNANATLAQAAPAAGVNRVGVEIIRPPDPSLPSGAGIVIDHGETTLEWVAPQAALSNVAPATAPVGG